MNCLITGASGFVGKSLWAALSMRALGVRIAMRSFQDRADDFKGVVVGTIDAETPWSEALRGIDTVVHLAARVHVMNDVSENPLVEFRRVNVDGTLNLARQAAAAGVRRFVFISSVKVNGEHTEFGHAFSETDAPNPQDAYGLSKHEAEQGLRQMAAETGKIGRAHV